MQATKSWEQKVPTHDNPPSPSKTMFLRIPDFLLEGVGALKNHVADWWITQVLEAIRERKAYTLERGGGGGGDAQPYTLSLYLPLFLAQSTYPCRFSSSGGKSPLW